MWSPKLHVAGSMPVIRATKVYKTLTIHKKITVKETFVLLCGIRWEDLSFLFSIEERIEIYYNKLKLEGIL